MGIRMDFINHAINRRGLLEKINSAGAMIFNELSQGVQSADIVTAKYLKRAAEAVERAKNANLFDDDRLLPERLQQLMITVQAEKYLLMRAHQLAQLVVVSEDLSS